VIAHKNLRKYLFIPALIAGLVIPNQANAAPKPIAVKTIVKWGESADIELLAATAEAVVTVKNTTTNSSNIEVQARDFAGTSLWTKTIDSGADEVATAIAADNQGNIWLAGNSAGVAIADTTTATSGALNPDNVVTESAAPARQDMRQLTLWKISKTGELTETFSTISTEISIVDAISVSATGLSIIGTRESGSFVISTNLKGLFTKELKIGTAKTKLNSIVRSGDGSINVFGSSAETLLGKKLAGREDGVLIKISKTGAISSVVRSSAPKALRSWTSATSALLLTGSVKSGTTTESAITKFSSSFAPTWTTRIASTGISLAAAGPSKSFYVALEPTAAVKGLAPYKFGKGQNLILQFDSKGLLIGAFSAPEFGQAKAMTFSATGGLFALTESGLFKVGATK
jgi:hypothetical protein